MKMRGNGRLHSISKAWNFLLCSILRHKSEPYAVRLGEEVFAGFGPCSRCGEHNDLRVKIK